MPVRSASDRIWSSSTVFPTPRSPTIKTLFAEFPSLIRAMATRTCSRIRSRPANSGGGEPAPGEYGFSTGSMNITSLGNLCYLHKLAKFTIHPPKYRNQSPKLSFTAISISCSEQPVTRNSPLPTALAGPNQTILPPLCFTAFETYGSELKADMHIGYLTHLGMEYYRPLGMSRFFVSLT